MQDTLIDTLIEECTENIEETRLVKNENKHKYSSCTLFIVLFSLSFAINIGIATYFAYFYWYLKKDDARVMLDTHTETTIY